MKNLDAFYDQMPTQEQFDNFVVKYEDENAEMRKNAEYRMQNYYNCVDDYSWGGICDKAADEAYSKRRLLYNDLKHQLKNGAFIETIETSVLCDMNGSIVSEKIVNGRFGECWIIENANHPTFVGVAKKQLTYNNKGYNVQKRVIEVEFYYLTNGRIISRILSNKVVNEFMCNQTTYVPKYLWVATQNN